MLRTLDLFSGIGGFSLGLERTGGFRTVAFCEIDPFCRKVLAKHWPEVPIYEDIRGLVANPASTRCGTGKSETCRSARHGTRGPELERFRSPRGVTDGTTGIDGPIDVVCGGFPCQDISTAGRGAGIDGERSGLWRELARVLGEVRPRYAVLENVAALLGRGLGRVLGDLSEIGYDAEWHCIPAAAVGAPHRRDRVWIIAYPDGGGREGSAQQERERDRAQMPDRGGEGDVANADGERQQQPQGLVEGLGRRAGDGGEDLAVAQSGRRHDIAAEIPTTGSQGPTGGCSGEFGMASPNIEPSLRTAIARRQCSQWRVEPDVGRVAHGVPARVDRLRSLGNAVVPQVVETIGRAILSADHHLPPPLRPAPLTRAPLGPLLDEFPPSRHRAPPSQ